MENAQQIVERALRDAERNDTITAVQGAQLREQILPLLAALSNEASIPDASDASKPQFIFSHILYYLGGLIAIGAMSLLLNAGWESFGGLGVFVLSLLYFSLGLFFSRRFERQNLVLPAGILAAFSVAMVPLVVFGIQQHLGIWADGAKFREYHSYIRWQWIYLELATLVVGAMVVYRFRYPFVLMPIAVTLWYLSMDFGAFLVKASSYGDFGFRADISMYFGLALLVLAVWVDQRDMQRRDFAFWLYMVAVLTFWGGLTAQNSDSHMAKLVYCFNNLALIFTGLLLNRKVFVVFGGLGVAVYLGYLAFEVFAGSFFFPIAVAAIGLGVIYLGIFWQRHEKRLTEKAFSLLPSRVAEFFRQIA